MLTARYSFRKRMTLDHEKDASWTGTLTADIVDALHSGSYNTRLIIVPKCVLRNVTLTAIFLNSLVEYQSITLKERFDSVG